MKKLTNDNALFESKICPECTYGEIIMTNILNFGNPIEDYEFTCEYCGYKFCASYYKNSDITEFLDYYKLNQINGWQKKISINGGNKYEI